MPSPIFNLAAYREGIHRAHEAEHIPIRYAPGKIMLEGAKRRLTQIFNPKDTVVVDTQHYRAMVAGENNPVALHFRKEFKSEFQTFEATIRWVF